MGHIFVLGKSGCEVSYFTWMCRNYSWATARGHFYLFLVAFDVLFENSFPLGFGSFGRQIRNLASRM